MKLMFWKSKKHSHMTPKDRRKAMQEEIIDTFEMKQMILSCALMMVVLSSSDFLWEWQGVWKGVVCWPEMLRKRYVFNINFIRLLEGISKYKGSMLLTSANICFKGSPRSPW